VMFHLSTNSNMEEVACGGIRGVQQIRRARPGSRRVSKSAGSKVRAKKHGVQAVSLLRSLLDCSYQLASISPLLATEHKDLPMHDNSNDDIADSGSLHRYYYGQEIQSYEEFYNIVAGDDEIFDDQHVGSIKTNYGEPRRFFGKEIHFYEEFYNLTGGDEESFDDEQPKTMHRSQHRCRFASPRFFFSREIESYEEFHSIAGSNGQFDDEMA